MLFRGDAEQSALGTDDSFERERESSLRPPQAWQAAGLKGEAIKDVKGFGLPAAMDPVALFAQLALRVGLTERWGSRATFKFGCSVLSATLPIIGRSATGRAPLGTCAVTHFLVIGSALLQMQCYNNFHASFLEASMVTYLRLSALSRDLISVSTNDPTLLARTKIQRRRLPIFLPLVTPSNVVTWLRLRHATHLFASSFRSRIDFYVITCFMRVVLGIGLLLGVSRVDRAPCRLARGS
jgi:hypothetical protein